MNAGPRPRGSPLPWFLTAAAALVAALSLGYTLALRSELSAAQRSAREAMAQVQTLQAQAIDLEGGVARLKHVVDVVTAPDVRQVRLSGSGGPASDASGLAYVSASVGVVVHATGMPALDAGRGYELWVIPPGAQPVSLGMLAVDGATVSRSAALPPGVGGGIVAVTVEAAAGSSSGQPTTAPVLVGSES